jgi:hypothetical protein
VTKHLRKKLKGMNCFGSQLQRFQSIVILLHCDGPGVRHITAAGACGREICSLHGSQETERGEGSGEKNILFRGMPPRGVEMTQTMYAHANK